MAEAENPGIPELGGFAVKLRQGRRSNSGSAMIMPYSQGQAEGQVNKLKLIKRSMYSRGKFDLLRQLVLYAATS